MFTYVGLPQCSWNNTQVLGVPAGVTECITCLQCWVPAIVPLVFDSVVINPVAVGAALTITQDAVTTGKLVFNSGTLVLDSRLSINANTSCR